MPEMEVVRTEDELGKKWDRCLSDSLIKIGGGVGLGALFSLMFFKRRAWPILLGTGTGLGMSYSNCQHAMQSAYVPGPVRRKAYALPSSSSSASASRSADHSHSALNSHSPQFDDKEMKDTSKTAAVANR